MRQKRAGSRRRGSIGTGRMIWQSSNRSGHEGLGASGAERTNIDGRDGASSE